MERENEVVCPNCGRIIEPDEEVLSTVDGDVCTDCQYDYIRCDHCGDMHHRNDVVEMNDGTVLCTDCADELTFVCSDCENRVYRRNGSYTTECGDVVCEECYNDHYRTCVECGYIYHIDDMTWCDEADAWYCEDCYARIESQPRIRDYHDNPAVEFFGSMRNGEPNHIGFELEVDRRNYDEHQDETLDELTDIAGSRVYFMHDGSLDRGFEIISQPHTIEELTSDSGLNIKEILRCLIRRGYLSHNKETCGLHFHLSREMFGPEEYRDTAIQKMMIFYDTFYDDVVKFARRKVGQLHWCEKNSADPNEDLTNRELSQKYEDIMEKNTTHSDRYKCVNTTNARTVEIRIMRGTLNYDTFMASLDFIYTIAQNSKTIAWNDVMNARFWLHGLKSSTKEYMHRAGAFLSYI